MRDSTLYLNDILKAIALIESFVAGMDCATFHNEEKTKSAVVRQFEVIGEAAKMIPDTIRIEHPDIPWKKMAGMRDKLIHSYFGIDYETVWATIEEFLPALKSAMHEAIPDTPKKSNPSDSQ